MTSRHSRNAATLSTLMTAALVLSACGQESDAGTASSAPASPTTVAGANAREVSGITPRVVMSHEKGISVVDTATGDVVSTTEHPGFLRLNNAGDGRHVMVSDGDTFRVFDAGVQAKGHDDHAHYFTYDPGMTAVSYAAPEAGHVVTHAGLTTLFADGTGEIRVLDSSKIAQPQAPSQLHRTDTPHHGVAFELANGHLITTQGTESARNVIQVKDGAKVVAETQDCPNIHGEATAAPSAKGDVVVFGCTNGPVVFKDGRFTKVPVKDTYSRSGNLFGHPASPVVLGDYKVDKEAELERPTRIALIDTRTATLSLVDLGSEYWFRSFARGPKGEAAVLTYDGKLNIVNPTTGKVTARVPAVAPWREKDDWQQPGPAVKAHGNQIFVTDAENRKLVVVDLPSAKVTHTFDLPHTPVEFVVVDGTPEAPTAEEQNAHEGHDH